MHTLPGRIRKQPRWTRVTRGGQVEGSLQQDGISLGPLKCDRAKEGATWGNAVYVAKAPGNKASELHENWNCGHDGCIAVLAILYRKADVDTVECAGG